MFILLRQADGSLKAAARNDDVVYDEWATQYGGDAFGGISAEKGQFTISFYYHGGGGHTTISLSFRYSAPSRDWFLDSYSNQYTSDTPNEGGGYDDTQTQYKTAKDFGKLSFGEFKHESIPYR